VSVIASALDAIPFCDSFWQKIHKTNINNAIDKLNRGGIDNVKLDDASTPNNIILTFDCDFKNDMEFLGFYSGYKHFKVAMIPDFVLNVKIDIVGGNELDKEFIHHRVENWIKS
jgi:hypothetical protein